MFLKKLRWAAALGAVLAGQSIAGRGRAESPAAMLGRPVAAAAPIAVLEHPVAVGAAPSLPPRPPEPPIPEPPPAPVTPVGYQEPGVVVRGQQGDGPYLTMYQPPPPPPPPSGAGPVTPPYDAPPGGYNPNAPYDQPVGPSGHGFWDHCRDWLGGSNGQHGFHCESDKAYDSLITPVSNPFFFEDPRAVTEVRPLFIFQTSPKGTPIFAGGDAFFYGLQGRLALNDRWSIVINKLGVVTFDPNQPTDEVNKKTGFAEFNIGPKFTFLHNTTNNTVAAVGVNFDLPIGSSTVLQNTGTLSIDPYITFGHTFGQTSWGQFNLVSTTGFNFGVDDKRSDFFHTALHLDFDIARTHKWYPLLELNWFHYMASGKDRDLGFEGVDLGNFGSTGVSGHDDLTMAAGVRYRFNEHMQFGIAAEFPLVKSQDIQEFRLLLDLIFRF